MQFQFFAMRPHCVFLLTRIDNWNNKNDLDIVNYQDPLEFLKRLEFHELNENLGNYI